MAMGCSCVTALPGGPKISGEPVTQALTCGKAAPMTLRRGAFF